MYGVNGQDVCYYTLFVESMIVVTMWQHSCFYELFIDFSLGHV